MDDLIAILNYKNGSSTDSHQANATESQDDKDYYENEDKRRFHIVYIKKYRLIGFSQRTQGYYPDIFENSPLQEELN